jgi:hypothetical protein
LALQDVRAPREVLAMSTLDFGFRIFGRLSSEYQRERENAAHAMFRLCASEGVSITDLAIALENSDPEIAEKKYTDADAHAIFMRGVEKGRAENRAASLSATYFDIDGEPRWDEMVKFCQQNPAFTSLEPNEQESIAELPLKLRWRSPTRPVGGFLISIFWKLGGSFK